MADLFGGIIDVPEQVAADVFPLYADFDVEQAIGYDVVIHPITFKREQRILRKFLGRSWRISKGAAQSSQIDALVAFYDAHKDPTAPFYFYDPIESEGQIDLSGFLELGRYTARFANSELSAQGVLDAVWAGTFELVEVEIELSGRHPVITVDHHNLETIDGTWPDRKFSGLSYLARSTFCRYGDATFDDYGTTCDLIHYVSIQPSVDGDQSNNDNTIKVADRRVEFVSTDPPDTDSSWFDGLYLSRLMEWSLHDELNSSSEGHFTFDNADGVWTEYLKQVDLQHATLRFNVWLQSGPHYLWSGAVRQTIDHRGDGTIEIVAQPQRKGLEQDFPTRKVSSNCPLDFKGDECTYSGGDTACLRTLADCTSRSNEDHFQGVEVDPMTAQGRLARSGFLSRRERYSSISSALDTIYGKPIGILYMSAGNRMIIEADIFETRDESEFFVASGVVCEGPLGASGDLLSAIFGQGLLDNYTQHDPAYPPLRNRGDWPYAAETGLGGGTIINPDFKSARLAYWSIRRIDEPGLQPKSETHKMLIEVKTGTRCITPNWGSGSTPTWAEGLVNNVPFAIIDIASRALNVRYPNGPGQPFYTNHLIDNGAVHDAVTRCVSDGYNDLRCFMKEPQQAIDAVRQILLNAPIDLCWSYGLIRLKYRRDEVTGFPVTGALTYEEDQGMILDSFQSVRFEPHFNDLTLVFNDKDFDFNSRDFHLVDTAHQKRIGYSNLPLPLKYQVQLIGLTDRTQVQKLAYQMIREELGGQTADEQLAAREMTFDLPLTGLADLCGEVGRVIHQQLPDGVAYARVTSWNYDSQSMRVTLGMKTVVASMYDTPGGTDITPSELGGDPVTGIPGGSQGADGTENEPATLTAPTLTLVKITYRTAVLRPDAPPQFTTKLVYQVSASSGFGTVVETILPVPVLEFNVGGSADTVRYIRAKWRRTSAQSPITDIDSSWSGTVTLTFPLIDGATETNITGGGMEVKEIDGAPDVSPVTIIRVSNGRLTDDSGGQVTIDIATVAAHATSHKSAGSDVIKIDEFATGTDITALNASTTEHGLLRKLSGVGTDFLNGSGGWTAPAGQANAAVAGGAIHQHLSKPTTTGYDTLGYSALAFTTVGTNANGDSANGAYNKYTTNAANTARAGINGGTSNWLQTRWNPTSVFVFEIDTIATIRMFIGWADQDINALAATDPTAQLAMFRYDTGVDSSGQLAIITNDGSGGGTITQNVATIAANTRYTGMIVSRAGGTAIDFYWNGVLVGTHSTNLPTVSTTIGYSCMITTLANVAAVLRYSRDALYY